MSTALSPSFALHNEEVTRVWQAYRERCPERVPMIVGLSVRYTIFNNDANPQGYSFRDFFEDPRVMYEHQLRHQWWVRHHLLQDAELGPATEYTVSVDLQNSYEALWFGCPLEYRDGQCPDTLPFLTDDTKWSIFDRGAPDPFRDGGWMQRAWEYLEYFRERAAGDEFHGAPVRVGHVPGVGTDGPLTVACSLRGATEVMLDMYTDPDYYHRLMDFIVEATIARIHAYRERLELPLESTAWGFADDSVQLISVEAYRRFVLPFHQRLIEEFGREGPNSIHLCGNATHLFPTIRDELHVQSFDTGFPVDHGALRRALGPDIEILGGPHVELLRAGPPAAIEAEARRILESGVTEGGRFILREGNNLAPGTPPEHVAAMYGACKRWGSYEADA